MDQNIEEEVLVSLAEIEKEFADNAKMELTANISSFMRLTLSHEKSTIDQMGMYDIFLSIFNKHDIESDKACPKSLDFYMSAYSDNKGENYPSCTLDEIVNVFGIDKNEHIWRVDQYNHKKET